MSFDTQVERVVQSCFLHLQNISKIRPFLSNQTLFKDALVYSQLDYCSALYCNISQASLHCLQLVQNAAAKLFTGTQKFEHITPVLVFLHWLPVKLILKTDFKILLLPFKAFMVWHPPTSLSSWSHMQQAPEVSLRSSNTALLVVQRSGLVTEGDLALL